MRLLTRSDFDGLICAVLLKEAGVMSSWEFVHPKDVQDGVVEVTENDILANVPYAPGCGLWFDHHSSERERLDLSFTFEGASKVLPSCARVIWEYYGGHETFPEAMDEMLRYVDKCDSADLTIEEIQNPERWVLLSFIMDPRTGLGRYRDYRISNYQLMTELVELCRTEHVDDILKNPDVMERITRYHEQNELFRDMIEKNSTLRGRVLIIDLRRQAEIYTGNRFLPYTMYPRCNVSVQIIWGKQRLNTVFTVGKSIVDRGNPVDVGKLMLKYGGGGHEAVGTCQVETAAAEDVLNALVDQLNKTE